MSTSGITHSKDTTSSGSSSSSNINSSELPTTTSPLLFRLLRSYAILQTIAKFLPTRDLLKLRKTCTEWNGAFSTSLMTTCNRFQLIQSDIEGFHRSGHMENTYKVWHRDFRPSSICSKYLDFYSTFLDFKYRSEVDSLRQDVFELLPNMTHLEIDLAIFDFGTMSPTPLLQVIPRILPNLQRLVLISTERDVESQESRQLLQDIIHNAPNLHYLKLKLNFLAQPFLNGVNLTILRELSVSACSIYEYLPNGMFDTLVTFGTNNGLQLIKFKIKTVRFCEISGAGFQESIRLLTQFLYSQASSLQHLKIKTFFDSFVVSNDLLRMPAMENLHTLVLNVVQEGFRGKPVLHLERERLDLNFPRLRKLIYSSPYNRPLDPGIPRNEPHHELVDLALNDLSPNAVRQLVPLCPSIVSLKLKPRFDLGDEALEFVSFVCSTWPLLESFCLDTRHFVVPNLDEILTGVPRKFHTQLVRGLFGKWKKHTQFAENLFPFQTRAGIGDLKHLQVFTLIVSSCFNSNEVTDVTGYHCFAGRKLQRIQINSDGANLSPQCCADIQNALGQACVLDLNYKDFK